MQCVHNPCLVFSGSTAARFGILLLFRKALEACLIRVNMEIGYKPSEVSSLRLIFVYFL